MRKPLVASLAVLFLCPFLAAQTLKSLALPKPQITGGKPLMEVLAHRASDRTFATQPLTPQVISNLLWAAFGINRADGRRTAPSAANMQEIDIYLALPDGLYLWDAKANQLQQVLAADVRKSTGSQPFVATAALDLVYVADMAKVRIPTGDDKILWTGADTGVIVENVYLFCASEGLSTVVRATVDRTALATVMKLRPDQRIILSQTVGYPATK